jgi:3-oxoacyl-[acyl-carrier protein] reductase
MDLGIRGRVAVVTGGSTGIGLAVARLLLEDGAKVALVARNQERLDQAARDLTQATGGQVLAFAADVCEPSAPEQIIGATVEHFGALDILINNAGRAHAGGLMESSEDDWEQMTALKLSSMRRMCRAAIPLLAQRGWGRIVNMSSIGGIYPNPKLLVSHVLSAAINNLSKSLALEVAHQGILVNAVGIGAVATDNWAANMIPSVRRRRPELATASDAEVLALVGRESTPIGRPGAPEDIAAIAVFLASARNGFITGDTIEASGGADRFM